MACTPCAATISPSAARYPACAGTVAAIGVENFQTLIGSSDVASERSGVGATRRWSDQANG